MSFRISLEEFSELINIPEFERICYHKIEELKIVLNENIATYRRLKHRYRRLSVLNVEEGVPGPQSSNHRLYFFQLNKIDRLTWAPVHLEPDPPESLTPADILPPCLIDVLIRYHCDPDRIRSLTHSADRPNSPAYHSLLFTKYSDYHILGLILPTDQQIDLKKIVE
jgi:hypothetical protein